MTTPIAKSHHLDCPFREETKEFGRLDEDARRVANWKRYGPYLAERQWSTVREDYSGDGSCWEHFPHDHARSRAYRWGEDGLMGWCDRQCRLCFKVGLWNHQDAILKERLFGLTGPEGNHGEDVKELYYYLDSTPTHSYTRMMYQYPHKAYPYTDLVRISRERSKSEREYELLDTEVMDQGYWDVETVYAKASPGDVCIELRITNRGSTSAPLTLAPQFWWRNTWAWGCTHDGCERKPQMYRIVPDESGHQWTTGERARSLESTEPVLVVGSHPTLGRILMACDATASDGSPVHPLFTNNETNTARLYNERTSKGPFRDAFHTAIVHNQPHSLSAVSSGTMLAFHCALSALPPAQTVSLKLRFCELGGSQSADPSLVPFGAAFDAIVSQRYTECSAFYEMRFPAHIERPLALIGRQACAGLLISKQFFHYAVETWLNGDPDMPAPPSSRQHKTSRNTNWSHLFARDVISMPDKWEYPWFASWDLAFHTLPLARLDPLFAKEQLLLMLREWYMHPNGQLPAYEFAFGDVNPPVHAWAVWRVYKLSASRGHRDSAWLARCFQKLLINFTWWTNQKDKEGNNLFGGGFLGLDNISALDRSAPLPPNTHLQQADGTGWMSFFCVSMLEIALELACEADPVYEDLASKFFEHFTRIASSIDSVGGTGLWDEQDGFYYDKLRSEGTSTTLRIRSLVGLIPIFACFVIAPDTLKKLNGFRTRFEWFLAHKPQLAGRVTSHVDPQTGETTHLLAIPQADKLRRILAYLLDEQEFLAPFGIRSLSRYHEAHPFHYETEGHSHSVKYLPGESDTGMFGGNSNWRGPVWFPTTFLIIEALERYHFFYGDSFTVDFPTGSGHQLCLKSVALEICKRVVALFQASPSTHVRPCHGSDAPWYASANSRRDLVLFHEYFDPETGRGIGASHQTGWTALVALCIDRLAKAAQT